MPRPVYLSEPLNRVVKITAVLILLTSSFDIFLIAEAGGNYRFCQIVTPVLVVLAVVKAFRSARIPVLGALPLSIWFIFQIIFIPATDFWPKSVGYCLWLLLNFGLVFSFVQLFSADRRSLISILRWYAYSFAALAAFGVAQFVLPVLGFGGPFITQWWIPGALARVNGLSYEPSYFATYLLTGFVFTGSLLKNRSSLLPTISLRAIYLLTGLGIVLSSSRIGIAFLFIDVLLAQFRPWPSFLSDALRLRFALNKVRALIPSLLSITAISIFAVTALFALENNPAVALMFLNGTGISDTAAHSVIQRENAFEETVDVFLEHPLIGRSLGGVSTAIADRQGERIQSFEASKDYEGMSVFAEALAASGVIGIIPFVWFLIATVWKPLRLARIASPFYSGLLCALVRSLIFAWAVLQFNQNMLRPYLWTHIAILASVYAAAIQSVKAPAELCSSRQAV
ncbi:MAG TPA: hypothetical protein VHZ07_03015 [Bryobacteraceae bacterium]|jgi:hypothetical protein|nr:hypothetical protein [Bryobacteraceae bacterium]